MSTSSHKKRRKPSLKMKKTALILAENPRKSMGAAMREAGYSRFTANKPSDITNSPAWQGLMDKYLPEEYIAAKHMELTEAAKIEQLAIPYDGEKVPSMEEIKQLIEMTPGATYLGHCITGSSGQRQLRIIFLAPDYRSRKDAIDLAYRVRGKYESAKRAPVREARFSLSDLRRAREERDAARNSAIDVDKD